MRTRWKTDGGQGGRGETPMDHIGNKEEKATALNTTELLFKLYEVPVMPDGKFQNLQFDAVLLANNNTVLYMWKFVRRTYIMLCAL